MANITTSEAESDDEKAKWKKFLVIVLAILLIAIIIITAGYLFNKWRKEEQQKKSEEKKKRLKEVEEQLTKLEAKLISIRRQEKIILLGSRIVIAFFILWLDYYFIKHNNLPFDYETLSNKLLKFNSILVTCYTFAAFISHGTPSKFAEYLKSKIPYVLEKYLHVSTFTEYKQLSEEKINLIFEIKNLEDPNL